MFIVVVSIALTALIGVYVQSAQRNVDPIIRVRLLEAAQSKLDEIIALPYDAATPSGGIPACDTAGASACTNIAEGDMNDVDDFHGFSDNPYPNYDRDVTVVANNNRKLISVSVSAPGGETLTLAAFRYNF
jgi:MSHA pilin protein MshD